MLAFFSSIFAFIGKILDFLNNGLLGQHFMHTVNFLDEVLRDKSANVAIPTLSIVVLTVGIIVVIVAAYLLGSINFAIVISGKTYKQDIREFGSKNAGMTNMMRTYGKKAAGLTLLGDALKAAVASLLGYLILGTLGAYLAGLFCILGHVFPIYYKFKGGKGVVTAAVAILMWNPIVFVILFAIFALIVLLTKYISLGSVICVMLCPFLLNAFTKFCTGGKQALPLPYLICATLMAVIIVIKHRTNIKRLLSGTESKFSFKKSVKAADTNNEEQGTSEK